MAKVEVYRGETTAAEHLEMVGAKDCKVVVVLPDNVEGRVDGASDSSLLATVQALARYRAYPRPPRLRAVRYSRGVCSYQAREGVGSHPRCRHGSLAGTCNVDFSALTCTLRLL
eukprot:3339997-Rhodomonas_salina.4